MTELDHLFRLVADPAGVVDALERAGFVLDEGRRHPGQGTRNRRILFGRSFFEVLWVDDPEGARTNELRLDQRVVTGPASIGVCWRGDVVGAFGERRVEYRPAYAAGMTIHLRGDGAEGPLHFGFQTKTEAERQAHWPSRRAGVEAGLFAHPNGAREIESWRVEGDALVVVLEGLRADVEVPGVVRFEGR